MKKHDKKKSLDKNNEQKQVVAKQPKGVTTLKFGHFQLNTSSFWLTLVCILCGFILFQCSANIFMYNKIMGEFLKHENELIKMIVEKR